MISIIRTQLFRLKKSKTYWALLIVSAVLPLITMLLLMVLMEMLNSVEGLPSSQTISELLGVNALTQLAAVDTWSGDTSTISLIVSAVLLCREFTQGTMRNVLLANKSRSQMFFAYFLTSLIIGVGYFAINFAMTLLTYGLYLGFGNVSEGVAVTSVMCHFAMGLCSVVAVESCVCMFLFGTRKMSGAITFPLLICLIAPSIVSSIIETIVTGKALAGKVISDAATYCLPFFNWSTLNAEQPAPLNVGMISLYHLVFAAAFFCIGYFPFQKTDLK